MARIENSYMTADWKWSEFKTVEVQRLINDWIIKYEIFDGESLFQTDNGLIESPTLVAEILKTLDIDVRWKE